MTSTPAPEPTTTAPGSAVSPARVVVGVGGGIAAYKSAELIRRLRGNGHRVDVVPTQDALRFVGAATFEALSGRPVATDVFTDVPAVRHVETGQRADLVVIAPATADLMARAATGRADDLLTATLLVTRAPVLMAPAMHTEMWTHPATVDNVAALRRRGTVVIDPAVGRLTGADSGPGRLPEAEHLAALAELLLVRPDSLPDDLRGRHVLITAGGTREPLDPVRYLGNRSSGKQGFALALVAAARGARVTLVAANTELTTPPGVEVVPVGDARELESAVADRFDEVDVVVMAAAVADFRPVDVAGDKIKKAPGVDAPTVTLTHNPDILAGLVRRRTDQGRGPVIVGFAAETGDSTGSVLDHARAKLRRKGCDLLVVNDVSAGKAFAREENAVVLLDARGDEHPVPTAAKTVVGAAIWDAVRSLLDPS